MSGRNPLHNAGAMAIAPATRERIREAQIGVAYAAIRSHPGDPEAATREMLEILGIYRKTGLEKP